MKRIAAVSTAFALTSTAAAFTQSPGRTFVSNSRTSQIPLQMGLFDGMKDAFGAPPSMSLDSERETPIDRWMGWNVQAEDNMQAVASGMFIHC